MAQEANAGRYHIGMASRLSGVSTHTIRVWERRYGAINPERSAGGTREYNAEQVDKLIALRTLTESGHTIGGIAALELPALRELLAHARERGLVASSPATQEATVVAAVMTAIRALDMANAERALLEAASVFSPLAMVFGVVAPIVESIGKAWQDGELRIANEHAASSVLRTLLGSYVSRQLAREDAPMALCGTISGELHEFGGLMASLVAITQGWRVTYLGTSLPPLEFCHAIEATSAKLLMVSLVNPRTDESADLLRTLRETVPSTLQILVGGRSAIEYADIFSPDERVTSLRTLREQLAHSISSSDARPAHLSMKPHKH